MVEVDPIARFRVLVGDFCRYVENGPLSAGQLRAVLEELAESAGRLPLVEPSMDEYRDQLGLDWGCRKVGLRASETFGERRYYEVVHDGEEMLGDLVDDLIDIYRDLRRGLMIADQSETDAIWEWRFSYEIHWGAHARGAIAALGGMVDGDT